MKKLALLSVALLITLGVSAKKNAPIPKVILIGIGAKNPTFNETQYPHLSFYYTPNLKSEAEVGEGVKSAIALSGGVRENFVGEPKFIADANAEHDLKKSFFLFDNSGICFTHGYEIDRRGDYSNASGIDGTSLADAFKATIVKEKVAKESKKEMKLKKSDFMMNRKMPEFNITALDGSEVSIKTITESGEAVLLVFFQLSQDINIQEAKESGAGKTGKQFGKAMLAGAAGSGITNLCENLESQFFGYDAREK